MENITEKRMIFFSLTLKEFDSGYELICRLGNNLVLYIWTPIICLACFHNSQHLLKAYCVPDTSLNVFTYSFPELQHL